MKKTRESLEKEDNLGNAAIGDYIDMPSWVRYYLIKEIAGNNEASSIFFYKDSDLIDGKVYAGPIWDFDLSLGIIWGKSNMPSDQFYANTVGWYQKLYRNPVFREALEQMYKEEIRGKVEILISEKIDENAEEISQSYRMNALRWKNEIRLYDDTLEHQSEYLKQYLTDKITFLDNEWIYHTSDSAAVQDINSESNGQQAGASGFDYKIIVFFGGLLAMIAFTAALSIYDIRRNKKGVRDRTK